MRIALCSDEPYPVHNVIKQELLRLGHQIVSFGSFESGKEESWANVTEKAALSITSGDCDEGIFFCWTGTGASIAANKIPGIRAALCTDPGTAKGARVWNHANVLCLSNRILSEDIAKEILSVWFETPTGEQGTQGVNELQTIETRYLQQKT